MAEKLKGLLDRANSVLGGLLGDFPAGFNAGAVAGVAGYPGDIAYMLDTAGRALTGQHTQPAAQDFPGTTEYLAAKAGYPVPQSFSGQLGAAVGGILTPGPGDLAKFAPVLSAIPFWHGSPHKYDAVDLSKIGTGEGAQAYGWGYYGADTEQVAREYMKVDPSVPVPPRRTFQGQDLEPGTPEYHAARLAAEVGESLPSLRKLVSGWIAGAKPGEPIEGWQKTLEILNAAQKKSDFKQLKPQPYLYRGEYRWPDPAKEAATPLTGEDLLDWDKPLSGQSPEVQRALARMGIDVGTADHPYTGEGIYQTLAAKLMDTGSARYNGLADKRASEALAASGIPGIRYKDQMSRGSEGGTYNYVMFQDKGIKLLERNGEPIPAAAEFAARREGKPKPYREAMGGQ